MINLKREHKVTHWAIGFIFFCLIVFFLPFFARPQLLLGRNNDILWFFQNFHFFKDQLINFHHLPLWQNQILSGSPYLGDPQNPLLYLPNYLSVIIPLPAFMLLFFVLHFLIAGLGMYFLARKYGLGIPAAFFSAITYSYSPLFSAHLAEGHLNMLAAFAWFPLFLAGVYGLVSAKPKLFQAVLVGISGAAIMVNYLTVFVYALLAAAVLVILKFQLQKVKANLALLILAVLIFVAISLPQILTSLEYFPLTTRSLMAAEDVFPQFLSTRKFLWSIINPYAFSLKNLGAETTLASGILPMVAAALGFVLIKTKYKILLLLYLVLALFLALNLKSPGYGWLVSAFPLILMFRVATRFWFIGILLISLLGGYFLEKKLKLKFQLLFCAFTFLELITFGWYYFYSHPSVHVPSQGFNRLLQPLLSQQEYFRIYCVTGCPAEVRLTNKGMASGYNPLQMTNYFNYINRAAGYRFGSYAYALPPYQTFPDKPQPQSDLMALLGIKYIFSPYPLTDPQLRLVNLEDGLLLYENKNFLPRAFTMADGEIRALPVSSDLPGEMTVSLGAETKNAIINEPYMPLWQVVDQTGRRLHPVPFNEILLSVRTDNVTKLKFSFAPSARILIGLSLLASGISFSYLTWLAFKSIAKC